jgi:predicted TPR repeat methyltransferase
MIQSKAEIEDWYSSRDPWKYENDTEDIKRKDILLAELPDRVFDSVLDIGCGNGFITGDLPGKLILGVDISENAIQFANENNRKNHVSYEAANIFDLVNWDRTFDLIVITGVLYPQYIGSSSNLIYLIIDRLLNQDGILMSVHIDTWYTCRFPYNLFGEQLYNYKQYMHRMEAYQKWS